MPGELFFSQASLDFSKYESHPTFGLTRPYLEHQVTSDLFGQYDNRPFLFRSDLADGANGTLLVLSTAAPSLPRLGAPTYGLARDLRTTAFPTDFPAGTRLDFEIRLNATKDVQLVQGKRSKRLDVWEHARRHGPPGLSMDAVYRDFLIRRLAPAAEILDSRVTERSFLRVGRRGGRDSTISFVATNVIGSLVISDAHKFTELLTSGIGKSRSFGCGLLCLSAPGTVLPRRHPDASLTLER